MCYGDTDGDTSCLLRLVSAACRHVIIETNNTTARIFPAVPDCETPEFWDKMEKLIVLNRRLLAVGQTDAPDAVKTLQKVHPSPAPAVAFTSADAFVIMKMVTLPTCGDCHAGCTTGGG